MELLLDSLTVLDMTIAFDGKFYRESVFKEKKKRIYLFWHPLGLTEEKSLIDLVPENEGGKSPG